MAARQRWAGERGGERKNYPIFRDFPFRLNWRVFAVLRPLAAVGAVKLGGFRQRGRRRPQTPRNATNAICIDTRKETKDVTWGEPPKRWGLPPLT